MARDLKVRVGGPRDFSIPEVPEFVPYRKDADGFNYGITRPEIGVNAGLLPTSGPGAVQRTTYSGSYSITGSNDPANPLVISNVNFFSVMTVNGGYVDFYNCESTPDVSARPQACILAQNTNVKRVRVRRCRIRPSVPSYGTDAVKGHHTSVERCDISNTVDAFGSFNIYGPRTDNEFIGNVVYDLCKFDDDGWNNTPRTGHVDGTHNDCVQHQGGLGLVVLGNVMSGHNRYADGSRPTTLASLNTTQCVLVQCNVAINGVYYCDEIMVERNWVGPGFNQVFAFITRASGANTYEPSCKKNTFEYDSTRYYLIRGSVQANINGYSSQAMGTQVVYPEDENKYADAITVVDASKRGTNVPIRRDTSF